MPPKEDGLFLCSLIFLKAGHGRTWQDMAGHFRRFYWTLLSDLGDFTSLGLPILTRVILSNILERYGISDSALQIHDPKWKPAVKGMSQL